MKKEIYKNKYNNVLNYKNTKKELELYKNYFYKNYRKYLSSNKKIKILDIGCGNGLFLEFLKSMGYSNIEGIDLSTENIKICKSKGLKVENKEAFNFLKKSKGYDLIIMNDVIEHIKKEKIISLLKLIKRKLNKNGALIIKTLNMSNPISLNTLYCDFTHEWGYTEKSIKQVCENANFTKIKVKELIIYPNIKILDSFFPFIYKFIHLFYGKSGNKIFSKNLLCVAKK